MEEGPEDVMQVASDLPEGTVLWLRSFSRSHAPVAEFAILPTRQGWLQLLCSGDAAFRKHEAKYVRNETHRGAASLVGARFSRGTR